MADTLILDYGGVISLPQDEAFIRDMCQTLEVTKEEFQAHYYRLRPALDEGRATGWEFFTSLLHALGRDPSAFDLDELVERDLDSWFQLNADVVDALPRLRERYDTLAILSNMHTEGWERFQQVFFSFELFDEVFISALMSLSKPDPAIYRKVQDTLGVEPENILFVDDNSHNLAAAKFQGWGVHHFQDPKRSLEKILTMDIGEL